MKLKETKRWVQNQLFFCFFFFKGFSAPEVSRWSVLLSLAVIKGNSVWDIAAMCSRVALRSKG